MLPQIVTFHERHVEALTALINRHVGAMPPNSAHVDTETVLHVFTQYDRLWHHHYDERPYTPQNVRVLVALDGEHPLGMILYRWDDGREVGSIGYLLFEESCPETGDALILAAIADLSDNGCKRIMTWDRNPFGLGWTGVPAPWSHVCEALERCGFVIDDRWVLMIANTEVAAPPVLPQQPPDWHLLWTVDRGTREWRLDIFYQEEVAAECQFWRPPPHLAKSPGFDGWVTVEWIGVPEEFRRMGLARWLLTRQLAYHHEEGRPHVMLWTGPGNDPARGLYLDLGFTDGPQAYQYRLSH